MKLLSKIADAFIGRSELRIKEMEDALIEYHKLTALVTRIAKTVHEQQRMIQDLYAKNAVVFSVVKSSSDSSQLPELYPDKDKVQKSN